MAIRDLHNQIKASRALSPVAAAPTGTTAMVTQILDTAGFESHELLVITGSIADVDVTFTGLLEEGDDSALADNTTVAAGDMIGVENGTITAGSAVTGSTPGFADDNKVLKLGYKGGKRYIRYTFTPAANTGDICVAMIWLQSHPKTAPQSTQKI